MNNRKLYALGRLKSGVLNRTEQAYSDHLDALKARGEIEWFTFEGMTFKLAEGSRYTPDFTVLFPDGSMQIHEVKGRWLDDAKTKIKVASDKFPFQFKAIYAVPKRDGGGWREEEF
jgi:hypothetical protein